MKEEFDLSLIKEYEDEFEDFIEDVVLWPRYKKKGFWVAS